mgnify:CR=1 FL=1
MDKEQLLIQYFEKQLSEEARNQLHTLLETDPEFAADFAYRKQLQVALHKQERDALKQVLQNHEASSKRYFLKLKTLAIAASFLAVAVVSVIVYLNNQQKENLYDRYFSSYPNIIMPVTRSLTNEPGDTTKKAAFIAYENQDYASAKILFDSLSSDTTAGYAFFYSAVCTMEIQSFTEAVQQFNLFLEQKDSWQLADDAIWYQALCYLKLENKQAATELLKKLINRGVKHVEESKSLLQAIN